MRATQPCSHRNHCKLIRRTSHRLFAYSNSSAGAVDRLLGVEIARFVFGSEAAFQRQVKDDRVIGAALELAEGVRSEEDLLARAAERRAAKREDVPQR